ncbi:uncharacterized protein BP5553_02713 [Venustampulla echinocandica]|uniref:Uncharacterized protein n=1 Tax=Venustampulla echinocandica TaxID=2656787 RepID=A0A370TS88_9HELO|nr:uncharacterized protein BP5553_02713 [Venustampulla echinocandica]RDL38373.1 hypothetical protein BP5553_02713 [Venustampulla echinocandica]
MSDVEILVHTSAPSRGQDDARYRALAQAYIQFVPATIIALKDGNDEDEEAGRPSSDATDDITELVDSQLFEELWNSTQDGPASWESYRPDDEHDNNTTEDSPTQEISQSQQGRSETFVSPQLSFNSVLNNADSPAFRYHITCAELPSRKPAVSQEQDSAASWRPAPSTIADSQPDNGKGLPAFSSPTTMLELYLQQIDSSDVESQEAPSSRSRRNESESPSKMSNIQDGYLSSLPEVGNHDSLDSRMRYLDPPLRTNSLKIRHMTSSSGNVASQVPTPSERGSSPLATEIKSGDISDAYSYSDGSIPAIPSLLKYFPSQSKQASQRAELASTHDNSMHTASTPSGPSLTTSKSPSEHLPHRLENNGSDSHTPLAVESALSPRAAGDQKPQSSNPIMGYLRHGTSTSHAIQPPTPLKLDSQKQSEHRPSNHNPILASPHDPELQLKRRRPELSSGNTSSSASISSLLEPLQRLSKPQKKKRIVIDRSDNSRRLSSSSSGQTPEATSSITTRSQIITSWFDKLEIHPPPPATSSMNLTQEMLITESFHTLAQKMPMSKLYNPIHQTRDLRPMERGYWLINCDSWKDDLRMRNWNCLGNYIGKGMAGWGVWCVRDEEFGSIRVYCWGTVVGYVYLLLFMASESKVKRPGACWIGGDGEVVVRMPS